MKPFSGALVMLDCDGVLFDSEAANIAYYNAVLERLGESPLDQEGRHHAHRLATEQLFEWRFGEDAKRAEEAKKVARETDYAPFFRKLQPTDGLFSVLRWLKERYRTAMATNRGATLPALVERFELGPWFDLIVGTHDVARPKPAPDMLLYCLDHLGVDAGAAFYVGDSAGDLAAARAAGVAFVAVGPLAGAPEWIEDLRQLPDVLEEMRRAERETRSC